MKESGQIFNVADAHKINTFMKKELTPVSCNSTKLLQITLANVYKINPIT